MKKNTKGFTLIELLIVVVIIGILAAIAIPKFASTKQNAYLAAMKTDLRNLATAEEGYASNNSGAYKGGTVTQAAPLTDAAGATILLPSAGVTLTITATGTTGWSAIATHSALPATKKCAMFVNVAAVAPATNDGEPACQ